MQIDTNRLDQTRLLERLVQNMGPQPEARGLTDFQRTQPPIFGGSEDPVDAEDWLHLIGNKLDTARIAENERVPFATYQLRSDALFWWESFCHIPNLQFGMFIGSCHHHTHFISNWNLSSIKAPPNTTPQDSAARSKTQTQLAEVRQTNLIRLM